jgi:hypothetical protein
MTLDDTIKHISRQVQNRLNVRRGRNFELVVMNTLRRHGFTVTRINEVDGYSHGADLMVQNKFWGPVPIQCKIGADPKLGFRGLREARRNYPLSPLVACFFKHVPTIYDTRIHYKIWINRYPAPWNAYEYVELSAFLDILGDPGLALLSQGPAGKM